MNDYLMLMCAVITSLMLIFLVMMHEQDAKANCIKSAASQYYSVDDIERLCK